MSFFVPIVFKNLPPNMRITSDVPAGVNVSGRITRRYNNNFNPSSLQAVVDLKEASAGTFQYTLTKENIAAPEDVSITQINPLQIDLFIEEIIEKSLIVRPRYHGQIKKEHILQKIELSPNIVTIQGPKTKLETVTSIFTKEINLQDLDRTTNMIVQLDMPDRNIRLVNNQEVFVAHVVIIGFPIRKRFDDISIHLMNQTYVALINPKKFNLYLEGPEELLNNLDSSQLYGIIDMSQYTPGSHRIHPQPILPKGVSLLQQWPKVALWVKPQKLSEEESSGPQLPPQQPSSNSIGN
ncbi:MAG: hypothetical protein HQM14_00125 [SAR324 cluster bacterium]|nr:hypothetical protein [SAR324 cluster bacterium]